MKKGKLHRKSGEFACMSVAVSADEVYVIEDEELVPEAIDAVRACKWIMHNAGFDLFHLRRWATVEFRDHDTFWDTMLWERLMWNGYFESFGLDDLTRRYLDGSMDKKVRRAFEKADTMTPEMRTYAATDAAATWEIYFKQLNVLDSLPFGTALQRLWKEIEGPMVEIVPHFKGFKVDAEAWLALAAKNELTKDTLKASFDFNPASPIQVKAALAKKNIRVDDTQASTLLEHSQSKLVSAILTFRRAAKLAGTYGRKFLSDHVEPDGRVYAHYWTIGAATGRTASADPNMQNIPNSDTFRQCFIAERGKRLIIGDYSQQEPRIEASISQDQTLIDFFVGGHDIHLEVARKVFGMPDMQKDNPLRYHGKTLNLGIGYGLQARTLAERVNAQNKKDGRSDVLSVTQAEDIIAAYFREFKGVKSYIDHYRYLGERNGFVQTTYGRPMWMNPYNKHWMNNAINAPIQGGAADQTKLALVLLFNKCRDEGVSYPVVATVHDEIVLEVPRGEVRKYSEWLTWAMCHAGDMIYPNVPWTVEPKIGKTWQAKQTEDIEDEEGEDES